MLIILPPSETKAHGGSGAALNWDELSFPALNPLRQEIAAELSSLDADEALEVLTRQRVLSSPDYWKKTAIPGGVCVGKNVAIVLSRGAAQLPVDPPKSVNATPLEATVVARPCCGWSSVMVRSVVVISCSMNRSW